MKILFDHCAFDNQRFGGVPKYYVNLFKNFSRNNNIELSIKYSNNYDLQTLNLGIKTYNEDNQNINKVNIENFNNSIQTIIQNDFDVLHHTFYNDYFLKYIKKPFVITVHDLLQEKLYNTPTCANCSFCLDKLMNNSAHIITISNTTKDDIIDLYKIDENKISVIYHGYEKLSDNYKYIDLNIPYQYILWVGRRLTTNSLNYKNFIPFIFGVQQFLKNHNDIKLLILGEPINKFEYELFRQLGLLDQIVQIDFVNDDVMNTLYNKAFVFVFPSEYEGFGLPILEAYKNNCITLLNDTKIFREIGANTDLFFNMNNKPFELSNMLEDVYRLSNTDKQTILEIQNKKLLEYSWEKSALEHEKIYNSL